MKRRDLLAALCVLPAVPSWATPTRYAIGPGGARIRFDFNLMGGIQSGTVPLANADLRIDPERLSASTADVTADVRRARTGLFFATEAMKSEGVLDAQNHPTASFRSTRVILGSGGRISDGGALEGDLTLRGVTRPVRFEAAIYRPRGTAPTDLSRLSVLLKGSVDRFAFGASGYPDLVGPNVGIDIQVDIAAA
ncbi:MAG: YceI family protein [Pseudomonadota bacterium]